jgi:hypothetical protein
MNNDAGLRALFDALEKGLRNKDEAVFQACWTPEGYATNLVGGSGLEGREVFDQGTRKKWVLKPDLERTTVLVEGAALIVPCLVWAWEKEKAVDKVDLLLVREKDGYRILGGGEKRADVEALAKARSTK